MVRVWMADITPLLIEETENSDSMSMYYHNGNSKDIRANVKAGSGNDTIYTGVQDDYIEGGSGNDYIDSGSGNDEVYKRIGMLE